MNATHRQSFLSTVSEFAKLHASELTCAAVLLLMAINFFAVISRKGLTNDEKYHIPAGYYHLVFGDFQLNPEHPPLVKMLSAVPLLFVKPEAPSPSVSPTENPILQGHDAFQAFWDANPSRVEAIAYWTRVPMILLTLVFGLIVFAYTRYAGGKLAATLAVIMFGFEPTILAHGRVVQTDVPAAMAYFLFFFMLQRLIDRPTAHRAIQFGLASGFALVVKFSLVVILPVFFVALIFIVWRNYQRNGRWSDIALAAGAVIVAALIVVNIAYYFERTPLLPNNREAVIQEWPTHVTALTRGFHTLRTIIPPTYLLGVFVIIVHNEWGHYASMLGNYSRTGWWYYFPVAFALKTTIPFLLVSVTSLVWAIGRIVRRQDAKFWLPLIAIGLYTALSMKSHINIGVRHFLPVFPFFMLLSGVLLARLLELRHRRIVHVAVVILFAWMAVEITRAFPNYIPYMNELAWSHPHWYYLSDSNVEWGDDTEAMARYVAEQGETRVRAAVLGGWLSKGLYGVDYVNPMVVDQPVEPTRYIAIGASYLNGSTVPLIRDRAGKPVTEEQRRDFFAAYRDRQPEAVFGNSIYLFREY
jgi:4-amino-4-deoxy-L-arabinose transferase-like glycosyltransferase